MDTIYLIVFIVTLYFFYVLEGFPAIVNIMKMLFTKKMPED